MKKYLLVLLLIAAIPTAVMAAELTTVSINSYSTAYGGLTPVNTINGNGFNVNGPGTHVNTLSGHWLSSGSAATPPVVDEWIIFDLGKSVDLSGINFWNHNEYDAVVGPYLFEMLERGVRDMTIYADDDADIELDGNVIWQQAYTDVNKGVGLENTDYHQTFTTTGANNVRYVKFKITKSWSDGIGYTDAFVGFAEVRFDATILFDIDAGPDQAAVMSGASASITTDATLIGGPATITWSKLAGPGSVVFANASAEDTLATFDAEGFYTLQCEAVGGSGTRTDTMNVKVLPEGYNQIDPAGIAVSATSHFWFGDGEFTMNIPEYTLNGAGMILTAGGLVGYGTLYSGFDNNGGWYPNVVGDGSGDFTAYGEYIEYDLGAAYDINYIRLWNEQPDFGGYGILTVRGVQDANMLVSVDGENFTNLGTYTFMEAPGNETTDYSEIQPLTPGGPIRYIRLQPLTNFAYGTSRTMGDLIGVNEVRFSGTYVSQTPEVDAGAKVQAWISGGTADVTMDATITAESAYIIAWTVESGPATATFTPSNMVEDPTVTFTAPGIYTLKITIDDGIFVVSDTVNVYIRAEGDTGLVAHWKLNEGTGTTAYNDVAPADPATTATTAGTPTWITGKIDGAYAVNGADNFLATPAGSTFSFPNELTVACWASLDTPAFTWETLIAHGEIPPYELNTYQLRLNRSTETVRFDCGTTGNDNISFPLADADVEDGEWFHVVGTYDGSVIKLYINGLLRAQKAISGNLLADNGTGFDIGATTNFPFGGGEATAFSGGIDSVRVYNRFLDASEVLQVYFNDGGSACQYPLLGDLDEDCDVDLEDLALLASNWLVSNPLVP